MRIIAGSAGGIPLRLPKHDIRPTMEKIRGAIFSSLGERIVGARVLDLFAGSGAFGLEAMSRGAANATFVDHHRDAIAAIQSNFEKTKLPIHLMPRVRATPIRLQNCYRLPSLPQRSPTMDY
jgi:16S rRNA (guanine966-N2)-methyltransferase